MKSSKCQTCGFVGFLDTGNCKSCGAPFLQRAAPVAPRPINYGPPNQSPEGRKKGLAIASLVFGIVCFITFGLLGVIAIPGIIMAVVAMKKAKREPWIYGGHGIAIAALVLNIISLTATVMIGVIAAVAIPNLLAARVAANEGSAIYTLRMVSSAESTYQSVYQRYGTLEELASEQLIHPALANGLNNGYKFKLEITTGADDSQGFKVVGVPVSYESSGRRSFFVDESFVIRAADKGGVPSTKFDPPLPDYGPFDRSAYSDQ
jgi:type IV pilus assembly protein PilA